MEHGSGHLKISTQTVPGGVVVAPQGDIDLTGSPALRQELKRVQTDKAAKLIVNLAGVPYMDSSGVATLVEAMQAARRNKSTLVLCNLTGRVRSIFEIAKLESVFTIVPTLDDAMKG